MFDKYYFLVFR